MHGRVIQIKMNNMHLEKKTNHEILALTHLKSTIKNKKYVLCPFIDYTFCLIYFKPAITKKKMQHIQD